MGILPCSSTTNVSLATVALPVEGGVVVVVAAIRTRMAKSVASGESARHVSRKGK
jgi:hypothetical protein